MLHLHRAERADRLADALVEVLLDPLDDPFLAEVVSVPTRGVERWLAQRLSVRLGASTGRPDGVCANVLFPPPAAVVAAALAAIPSAAGPAPPAAAAAPAAPQAPAPPGLAGGGGRAWEDAVWHPARAVWTLLDVIDGCAGEGWCSVLGEHLGVSDADATRRGRRYSTARHLADLFDAYAGSRPQMLQAWQSGADTDGSGAGPHWVGARLPDDLRWQAELWRRLRRRIDRPSPAEHLLHACSMLRADPARAALPARLSLFGPTRLPAQHRAVLAALAEHRDVHLFLPHPSPVLWERVRAVPLVDPPHRRAADATADLARHPLLSSLGRDARELQVGLLTCGVPVVDRHYTRDGGPPTLLGRLQQDLRDDRDPAPSPGGPDLRPLLETGDRSVQLHSCHGPDRQVEVLREVVLGLLAVDPALEPRDVVVMTPDIDTFAPLITACFGLEPDGPRQDAAPHPGHRLRVRLADRSAHLTNPLLAALTELLELAEARLTVAEVLDFLSRAPVRRRFRLDDEQLERIRELTQRSGVRWGLDAAHRARFRLDAFAQNTWAAGLDRLLLGVAMSEDEQYWLDTVLPLDDVDSSDVALVGRFAEFLDRLGAVLRAMTGERPLTSWVQALGDGLDGLSAVPDADAWQVAQLRAELAAAVRSAGDLAGVLPLSLSDVKAALADRLRGRPSRANFRTGHLTMCTMQPMRSVPHRVVCLLGLDDGVFPRDAGGDGDDVLDRDPWVGERDPRSEDRQLLLDAVLAAQDHLVVVYSGADERTNAVRPPAVPIGELLDTIDTMVRTPDGAPARSRVVVRHPLQPFDPRNFTPGALGQPRPFSFDRANLAGAMAGAAVRVSAPAFLPDPLPPDTATSVTVDDLVAFLQHPCRAFLRQRLGLTLPSEDDEPDDALPVELAGLTRWAVGDRLLQSRISGLDPQRCGQAEWRRGYLPPGALGAALLDEMLPQVEQLVAASAELRVADPASFDVLVELPDGGRVVGTVAGVHGPCASTVVYSQLGPKHRLRCWVHLLALTASRPDTPWQAAAVGRGRGRRPVRSVLGPVPAPTAARVLGELVELRRNGLRAPLPMAPATSFAYAGCRLRGGSAAESMTEAEKAWAGGDYAENLDPAHRLVWGRRAPLSTLTAAPADRAHPAGAPGPDEPCRFADLAVRLWRPVLAAESTQRS